MINDGAKIKQRREELGLTQQELANRLGYKSRSSINKIELSRDIPLKKIEQFADALETTVPELMGFGNKEIEKQAERDSRLICYSEELKNYFIKFAELDDKNKKIIMKMIDLLNEK